MKRLILAATQTDDDGTRSPNIPAAATAWVTLHDFGPRMLVKVVLPDGTPKTANTIADVTIVVDEVGSHRQVEINAEPLTQAQRNAAKTFLENQGFSIEHFDGDGIQNRAHLLRFILRRLAHWQDMTPRELLEGWDAS